MSIKAAYLLEEDIYTNIRNRWIAQKNVIPVPIVAYEGGQHLTPNGFNNNNPGFTEFLGNLNRHPLMKSIYLTHWHLWKSLGFGTPSLFTEMSTWGTSGYWGAKQMAGDTQITHPKWGAYLDFLADQASVRAVGYPINSAPSFITTSISGLEKELNSSIVIEATGGDGIEHVGGFLPDGISFNDNGDGTATYLAAGQAGQARDWIRSIQQIRSIRELLITPKDCAVLGALVSIVTQGVEDWYFIVPAAGGY